MIESIVIYLIIGLIVSFIFESINVNNENPVVIDPELMKYVRILFILGWPVYVFLFVLHFIDDFLHRWGKK